MFDWVVIGTGAGLMFAEAAAKAEEELAARQPAAAKPEAEDEELKPEAESDEEKAQREADAKEARGE